MSAQDCYQPTRKRCYPHQLPEATRGSASWRLPQKYGWLQMPKAAPESSSSSNKSKGNHLPRHWLWLLPPPHHHLHQLLPSCLSLTHNLSKNSRLRLLDFLYPSTQDQTEEPPQLFPHTQSRCHGRGGGGDDTCRLWLPRPGEASLLPTSFSLRGLSLARTVPGKAGFHRDPSALGNL